MKPQKNVQEKLYRDLVGDQALARQKRDAATKCKSCGAPIRWARTGSGRHMPVDYDEHDGGNVFLFKDGTCFTGHQENPTPVDATRHYSHFATCPHADRHRTPRLGDDVR